MFFNNKCWKDQKLKKIKTDEITNKIVVEENWPKTSDGPAKKVNRSD